jgi:hypothetical protein
VVIFISIVNLYSPVALNPLTEKQSRFWSLRDQGLNLSQIGRMVGVTRQAVSKTLIQADKIVRQTLVDAAKSYKIDLYRVNQERGVAHGFSKALNSPVFITYSPERGLNIWYRNKGDCEGCDREKECRDLILGEAERLGIKSDDLAPEKGSFTPACIAERLYDIIFPGDE